MPFLLTLSDVYGTGYHAEKLGEVKPGSTVMVIGDGTVGLLAVPLAKQLGAEVAVAKVRSHHRARRGPRRLHVNGRAP